MLLKKLFNILLRTKLFRKIKLNSYECIFSGIILHHNLLDRPDILMPFKCLVI